MDPDENLTEQLQLVQRLRAYFELRGPEREWEADADRLAELVEALHGWIRNGGFLPAAWNPEKQCNHHPDPHSILCSGDGETMDCTCIKCGQSGSFFFQDHTAEIMWE